MTLLQQSETDGATTAPAVSLRHLTKRFGDGLEHRL